MTVDPFDGHCEPPRLGALEEQVMDVLWARGGARVREIIDALPGSLAYTTIATVLGNLERKCLVEPMRAGRAVEYAPRCTRERYTAAVMTYALAQSPHRAETMLSFVESLGADDRRLLRECLATGAPVSAQTSPQD